MSVGACVLQPWLGMIDMVQLDAVELTSLTSRCFFMWRTVMGNTDLIAEFWPRPLLLPIQRLSLAGASCLHEHGIATVDRVFGAVNEQLLPCATLLHGRLERARGSAVLGRRCVVVGSIERGAGASLACSAGIVFQVFACWEMGRRPESIGVEISKTIPRGHPELSLDPQCMQQFPMGHCLPKNVAPYWSRTPFDLSSEI